MEMTEEIFLTFGKKTFKYSVKFMSHTFLKSAFLKFICQIAQIPPRLSHSGVTCMGNSTGKVLWTDSNAQSLSSLQYWGIERQQESWKWRNEIYLEMEEIRKKVFLVWTLFPTVVISF